MRPFAASLAICLADQATKLLVVRFFAPGQSLPIIPSIFHLTYVQNTGAAFGLLKGQQWLFVACSLAVAGWIIREFLRGAHLPLVIETAYALVLGGSAGNLIDRMRLHYVIDFLDFRIWPVFNVGDSAITIGVALVVLHQLFLDRRGA